MYKLTKEEADALLITRRGECTGDLTIVDRTPWTELENDNAFIREVIFHSGTYRKFFRLILLYNTKEGDLGYIQTEDERLLGKETTEDEDRKGTMEYDLNCSEVDRQATETWKWNCVVE